MIHEVSGDILLSGAAAIAHGVAPNDHFTNGLALALREKWPAMTKSFHHYVNQCHPKPGEIWSWGGLDFTVYTLLTQEGEHNHGSKPGPASTANVNHCLRRLRHEIEKGKVQSLALPRLATGLGGLDWKDVFPIVKSQLGELDIPIFVYSKYEPGVAAVEPGI
jgi:O-acetyl-ADP-ribose deacetylase (regulator of RNase III)